MVAGCTCYKVPSIVGSSNEILLETLPSATIHEVPLLDKEETLLILNHYKKLGALYGSMDGKFLEKKFFLSGGVVQNLFECIVYDTVY